MLPDSTSRTRSASQSGSSLSNACAVVIMPGVQKPHCSAWCLRNDACSGVKPSSSDRPSTVTTLAPSACTASNRQERTAAPSTSTVQEPQTPCSQPTWVPVSRKWWRRQSASVSRGSTSTSTGLPLTSNFTGMVLLRRRAFERALDHHADQRFAIGAAGVDIVMGIDRRRCRAFGLDDDGLVDLVAVENLLDGGQPQRPVGDADGADMGVTRLAAILVVEQHRRGKREVAAAAREFLKTEAALGRPCRQADFGDDLVGF